MIKKKKYPRETLDSCRCLIFFFLKSVYGIPTKIQRLSVRSKRNKQRLDCQKYGGLVPKFHQIKERVVVEVEEVESG